MRGPRAALAAPAAARRPTTHPVSTLVRARRLVLLLVGCARAAAPVSPPRPAGLGAGGGLVAACVGLASHAQEAAGGGRSQGQGRQRAAGQESRRQAAAQGARGRARTGRSGARGGRAWAQRKPRACERRALWRLAAKKGAGQCARVAACAHSGRAGQVLQPRRRLLGLAWPASHTRERYASCVRAGSD